MNPAAINRSQGIVLGFFAGAVLALIAILVIAPDVYAEELHLAEGARIGFSLAFLAALIVFIASSDSACCAVGAGRSG